MKTVTLGLSSIDAAKGELARAFAGEAPVGCDAPERIDFTSIELLWRVLTPQSWDLLRTMAGQGPLAMREVARRIGRDVKGVLGDLHALIAAGLLDRTADGRVVFPYDAVHVDFTLRART
jgi:predicted transcriptional regulator